MNEEIKAEWLAALRGGQYKQVTKVLHDGAGFCCLGVLCDLHQKESKQTWHDDVSDDDQPCQGYLGEVAILPEEVRKWAGLNSAVPYVKTDEGLTSVAVLNDKGMPFSEIAKFIQEQL